MKMRKLIALIMATLLIAAMALNAFAADGGSGSSVSGSTSDTVTITVERDSSYNGEGDPSGTGRAFTWYKIFSVTIMSGSATNFDGGHTSGVANVNNSGTKGFAYIATNDVAQAIFNHSGTTTANKWFELTQIAGSTNYVVSWKNGVATDADTLQEVAKWLIAVGAYEATGTMTFDGSNKWTADVEKGYYVISSDTGDNVIAATTDIKVKEKNEYPPIKKVQKDEDTSGTTSGTSGTYVDASGTVYLDENGNPVKVAIGDKVDYKVIVKIPSSAKVGDTIEVWDTPSVGLTYNGDVAFTPASQAANVSFATLSGTTSEAWRATITVTADNKGTEIIFSYSMTINDQALVDTGRENEVALTYGNNYESIPHHNNYKTYFTGIEKVDGDDSGTKLEGVEFTLKEDGVEFYVSKPSGSEWYIPDASGSYTVVTNVSGTIMIRGLDGDKTYTLTETKTNDGYNMLTSGVTLILEEETSGAFAITNKWQVVENRKGTLLPSTGGIGTTIFYVVGAILVLGAGVVLVTRRRMSDNN